MPLQLRTPFTRDNEMRPEPFELGNFRSNETTTREYQTRTVERAEHKSDDGDGTGWRLAWRKPKR